MGKLADKLAHVPPGEPGNVVALPLGKVAGEPKLAWGELKPPKPAS